MNDLIHISFGTAGAVAVLGYLVVFLGLTLLMLVVLLLSRIMKNRNAEQRTSEAADELLQTPSQTGAKPGAGTGEIELYGTNPREAAVVMAIIADRLGKPLEEIRFRSIREVK